MQQVMTPEQAKALFHRMQRMNKEFFPVTMVKTPLDTNEHFQIPDTSPTPLDLYAHWQESRFKFVWSREVLGKSDEVLDIVATSPRDSQHWQERPLIDNAKSMLEQGFVY
jgi:hypothetical protein